MQKKSSIEKVFASFVPPEHVPDKYTLSKDGLSGSITAAVQQLIHGGAEMRRTERRKCAVALEAGDAVMVSEHGCPEGWLRVRVVSVNRTETPQLVVLPSGTQLSWPDCTQMRDATTIKYESKSHDHDLVIALDGRAPGTLPDLEAAADALGISRISVIKAAASRLLKSRRLAAADALEAECKSKVVESMKRIEIEEGALLRPVAEYLITQVEEREDRELKMEQQVIAGEEDSKLKAVRSKLKKIRRSFITKKRKADRNALQEKQKNEKKARIQEQKRVQK